MGYWVVDMMGYWVLDGILGGHLKVGKNCTKRLAQLEKRRNGFYYKSSKCFKSKGLDKKTRVSYALK